MASPSNTNMLTGFALVVAAAVLLYCGFRWLEEPSNGAAQNGTGVFTGALDADATAPLSALKRLQARTEVGVSYAQYGPALAEARYAVKEYLDKHPADSNQAALLQKALEAYEDANETWKYCLVVDYLTAADPMVELISVKHPGLLPQESPRGGYKMEDLLSKLWGLAGREIARAEGK